MELKMKRGISQSKTNALQLLAKQWWVLARDQSGQAKPKVARLLYELFFIMTPFFCLHVCTFLLASASVFC